MSDLQSYISGRQKRLSSFKDIFRTLSKELKAFFNAFLHTIMLYDGKIEPPKKQLDFESELTKEQVDQSKLIFNNSVRRREKLESKAEKLLGLLMIFTPLFSVLVTYLFSVKIHSNLLRIFLYLALCISILSIFLALIAILRSRKVGDIEEPFISVIIDHENDKIHKYSAKREGLGYLYCAINNQVRNDHIADFVRAAEYFVLINFIFLIISVFTVVFIKTTSKDKTPASLHATIHSEMKNLTNSMDNIEASINVTASQIKEIKKSLDTNNNNLINYIDRQSKAIEIIMNISKQQNELADNQTMLIKNLKDSYKETTTNKTQQKHAP